LAACFLFVEKDPAKKKHRRGLPIPLRIVSNLSYDSPPKTVAGAENQIRLTVARRRRLFTVFPSAESRVIVGGASKYLRRL
jgi:hypothetical protein